MSTWHTRGGHICHRLSRCSTRRELLLIDREQLSLLILSMFSLGVHFYLGFNSARICQFLRGGLAVLPTGDQDRKHH